MWRVLIFGTLVSSRTSRDTVVKHVKNVTQFASLEDGEKRILRVHAVFVEIGTVLKPYVKFS